MENTSGETAGRWFPSPKQVSYPQRIATSEKSGCQSRARWPQRKPGCLWVSKALLRLAGSLRYASGVGVGEWQTPDTTAYWVKQFGDTWRVSWSEQFSSIMCVHQCVSKTIPEVEKHTLPSYNLESRARLHREGVFTPLWHSRILEEIIGMVLTKSQGCLFKRK